MKLLFFFNKYIYILHWHIIQQAFYLEYLFIQHVNEKNSYFYY